MQCHTSTARISYTAEGEFVAVVSCEVGGHLQNGCFTCAEIPQATDWPQNPCGRWEGNTSLLAVAPSNVS
jgi:hypothetical protein